MGCIGGARTMGILGLGLAGRTGSPPWHCQCQPLECPTSSASESGAQTRRSTPGQVTVTIFLAGDRSQ